MLLLLSTLLFIIGSLIVQVFIPGFPKEVLLFQAGASFGIFWGSFVNWLGMVLGAQAGYEIVRQSVLAGGRFTDLLDRYQHSDFVTKLEDKGNHGLFFLRLVPYAPNDVLSMLAGGLLLPRRGFILVSITTAIPYAVVFAYMGSIGKDYFGLRTVYIINAIFLLVGLILGMAYYFVMERKKTEY